MTSKDGVRIEYIQNSVPFEESEEFVVVYNGSKGKYDLRGWKVEYVDLHKNKILHTHFFQPLRGSFDPGERLCILSSTGTNSFSDQGKEKRFPGAHWDLFTDHPLQLMNVSAIHVRLIDESNQLIHSATVERNFNAQDPREISIFIGHGRDLQWRELKDHLQDQHSFKVVAYETDPRAGLSIKEVLQSMADSPSFALIVLTGEDVDADGGIHARENVVHELGLFQGRLGFTRAIAMLEQDVTEFSNIHGLTQLRFGKGRIKETFGDVLATLRREFEV